MKTKLLRMARRDRKGIRRWDCPGFDNGVAFIPSAHSFWENQSPMLRWPCADPRDPNIVVVRSVRLDWHRDIARRGVLEVIAICSARIISAS